MPLALSHQTPSVAFQMVQSSEISQAGNAGKKEDFEKLKLWLKNKETGLEILKVLWVFQLQQNIIFEYILEAFHYHLFMKTYNCKWSLNTS